MGIADFFFGGFFGEFFSFFAIIVQKRLREKIDGGRLLSSLSPNAAIFIRIE